MFDFLKRQRKVIVNNQEITDVKINNSTIDLKKEYVNDILKSKKLPIVLLDPLWLSAKDHIKSKTIEKAEKELQELLKEQGRLNTDFKEYTVVKQNFLKEILVVSNRAQETNSEADLEELNKLHQSTLSANKKLEEIEARLETIDEEINEKNKEIVSEMIAVGYSYIENYKEQNEKLENEIAVLREEMLKKTNKKKESDAFLKEIYNYLHSIVGREHIEILDKKLGDKK
ncbi:MAG: hypothetical protein J6F30_01970 [Cellulosilyticum sp.]|nr:hypothetical protein [Cellulosilyticum sp.]